MDIETLKNEIRSAFAGVELGNGIGLMQAQGLDDYEDAATVAAYRMLDEKHDWSKITVDQLNQCYSSLSFFDAEGMRFHLPAFLIAYLDGTFLQDVIFSLTYSEQGSLLCFDLLSAAQRQAVRDFFQYEISENDPVDFERPKIEKALAEYWNK
jgi:hypothetical protein